MRASEEINFVNDAFAHFDGYNPPSVRISTPAGAFEAFAKFSDRTTTDEACPLHNNNDNRNPKSISHCVRPVTKHRSCTRRLCLVCTRVSERFRAISFTSYNWRGAARLDERGSASSSELLQLPVTLSESIGNGCRGSCNSPPLRHRDTPARRVRRTKTDLANPFVLLTFHLLRAAEVAFARMGLLDNMLL